VLSEKCKAKLYAGHVKIVTLVTAVAEKCDVNVIQVARTPEEQLVAFTSGNSKTTHSKHLKVPAEAVDMGPIPFDWKNTESFVRFAQDIVLPTAKELGIEIRWGGAWNGTRNPPGSFDDLVHFELKGV
jgi:peptidoglycan L-alanyl-D-glutamate endopeptidase CwlK